MILGSQGLLFGQDWPCVRYQPCAILCVRLAALTFLCLYNLYGGVLTVLYYRKRFLCYQIVRNSGKDLDPDIALGAFRLV